MIRWICWARPLRGVPAWRVAYPLHLHIPCQLSTLSVGMTLAICNIYPWYSGRMSYPSGLLPGQIVLSGWHAYCTYIQDRWVSRWISNQGIPTLSTLTPLTVPCTVSNPPNPHVLPYIRISNSLRESVPVVSATRDGRGCGIGENNPRG